MMHQNMINILFLIFGLAIISTFYPDEAFSLISYALIIIFGAIFVFKSMNFLADEVKKHV